jgi:hypothetical protein
MATLPSFRTWTAGEIVTAAYMNSNVRDAGNFFLSWPVFEGRQAVAQSFTSGAPTALLIDTEDIDTDNGHSTVTNTSPVHAADGRAVPAVRRDGVGVERHRHPHRRAVEERRHLERRRRPTTARCPAPRPRFPTRTLTATANGTTDFFEVWALQTSGGALLTAVSAVDQPTFSVRMVGTT